MTLTNHLLAGSVIARFTPLPIAIPLAFASHFVLDALPHFGFPTIEERMKNMKKFRGVILLDIVSAVALIAWLTAQRHYSWLLVGAVAYSPDLLWIYRFAVEEKFGRVKPTKGNRFIQFHRDIQRYERPWGGFVELVFAGVMFTVLLAP